MFRLKCWTNSYSVLCTAIVFLFCINFYLNTFTSPNPSCSEKSCMYQSSSISTITVNLSEKISNQLNDEDYGDLVEYTDRGLINDFLKFPCKNVDLVRKEIRLDKHMVYVNAIAADKTVKCYESITFSTHADYRYLDNLESLSERWNGPISLAVYTPGSDLEKAIERMNFLRNCASSKILEWVTVHLFMDVNYMTAENNQTLNKLLHGEPLTQYYNCTSKPQFGNHLDTFRTKRLFYPVNIGRNLARSTATTHFVLSADIELYPSANLIPSFFKMLSKNQSLLDKHRKLVFVLPRFEVDYGNEVPKYKDELVELIKSGAAVLFHLHICPYCHRIPGYDEWIREDKLALNITHIAKRVSPFHQWEPCFIGTNYEPFFDERLSYEGLRDSIVQAYGMCLLGYDFAVLNNAFLVHREGIKKAAHNMSSSIVKKQEKVIYSIKKQLLSKYGSQNEKNCFILY